MEDNQYEYQGIQFIGKLSSEIYRRGYIYFTKRLVPFDINYIQLLCLISLYIKDNQSQEQITDDLSIDKSSVHRAIKGLIEKEYVSRVRDEKDKRVYLVSLTQKARDIQTQIEEMTKERENLLSDGIDPQEKAIAFKLLNQMTQNENQIYEEEKKKNHK